MKIPEGRMGVQGRQEVSKVEGFGRDGIFYVSAEFPDCFLSLHFLCDFNLNERLPLLLRS